MNPQHALTNLIAAILIAASTSLAAEPEVRGTWLTTTANDAISTPAKTAETMRRLREIGLNTVYIECWKNGYTEFPSPTMKDLIGVPMKINAAPPELQRDLLQEAVLEAHRNGMLAIAWFEYGFMAANKTTINPLRTLGEKEGWLLRDAAGELVGKQDEFVWMNPLHPKPQEILTKIVLEACRQYDLDGVQLDDRIAMPVEMGYDDYTRDLYAKDHAGRSPPTDSKDPQWLAWRADRLTEFARQLCMAVHRQNPNLIVSVSPAPYPWCYDQFACDWPTWMKWTGPGAWDECVVQNYRLDFERTKQSIEDDFRPIGPRRGDLLAGIRVVGDGPDLSPNDLIKSIQFTRDSKLGGHVLWFSKGVLDDHSKPLLDFYDVAHLGLAPHPRRSADWRTLPIVGKADSSGIWRFSIIHKEKYLAVVHENGSWKPLRSIGADAGELKLRVPDADGVELLVDRRP